MTDVSDPTILAATPANLRKRLEALQESKGGDCRIAYVRDSEEAAVNRPFNCGPLSIVLSPLVMPSLGSWSFPRSRAPHDDVRVGRLNVCNGVRARPPPAD